MFKVTLVNPVTFERVVFYAHSIERVLRQIAVKTMMGYVESDNPYPVLLAMHHFSLDHNWRVTIHNLEEPRDTFPALAPLSYYMTSNFFAYLKHYVSKRYPEIFTEYMECK